MKSSTLFICDHLATPLPNGRFLRGTSMGIYVDRNGMIQKVEKVSVRSSLRRSRGTKRFKCIAPGLVDPHTHLIFAGNRAEEWGERLKGKTYQQIASEGGGIQRTVRATRESSEKELIDSAIMRLQTMLSFGVTTVETKSGYGLDASTELRLLRAAQKIKKRIKQTLLVTFMGAHAVPREFSGESSYTNYLIEKILPQVAGLADFQDVFCESGYFSEGNSVKILEAGKKWGLRPRVHAHEFGRTGGVNAAARTQALSADHLMVMSTSDIQLLKRAGVVPVVLPGTSVFLGAKKFAPAQEMWQAGLKVAIGSDFNPGTNPTLNFPLCGFFAATFQKLSLEQVLTAQTLHAAYALGLRDRGVIARGFRADFQALSGEGFEEIYYNYGTSQVESVFIAGRKVT